jgi:fatty-acyl-CoA synthase
MSPNSIPLTPLSFLQRSADVFPDEVAVVDEDGHDITYRELRERAARLAEALRSSGIHPGDRVAVLAPNTATLLVAHFGVPGAGGVLVALNTRLGPSEYLHILGHSRARLLLVDDTLTDAVAELLGSLPALEQVVETGEGPPLLPGAVKLSAWSADSAPGPGLVPPDDENSPIAVNYTSGTSGRAKGVVYTHRGAYLNSLGTAISFGLSRETVYLWTLPMFHCNGWCFPWAVTAVGGRHVCLRKVEPAEVVRLIDRHRVSHFCAAPVVLNAIAHDPAAASTTFAHPVRVATGGSPPAPTTIDRVRAMGIELTHLYGLTETYGPSLLCEPQPGWASLDDDSLAWTMSRQGVRTLTVESARVVDAGLDDVPRDGSSVGEIVFRSNSVMAGYLDDPDATAAAFDNGWLHTGDLAVVHPDGYIEIHDRAKDIIITGGENVSSVEVENVLMSLPGVLEAAVVGRADDRWGEVPVAFVTLVEGASVTADELVAHVRARLAHFKAPKDIVFAPLPKTSTGKVRKTVLRDAVRRRADA